MPFPFNQADKLGHRQNVALLQYPCISITRQQYETDRLVDYQQLELAGLHEEANLFGGPAEQAYLRSQEKGELHVHLNGAVPFAMVREIFAEEATALPPGFDFERDFLRRVASPSLAHYLAPWQVLRRFPKLPRNLERMVDSAVAALGADCVRFAELRSSVLYLSLLQECSAVQALERLIEFTSAAAHRHGMRCGLVLTVTRGDYSAVHLIALLDAYKALGEPCEVVGLDLAGDEETPYPPELPGLFREAKERYGLGITIHAGETGRAQNILDAVKLFKADRIGHGTAAGRQPHLLDFLATNNVCVEVCPISNRLTGAVPPNEAHPLADFRRHGVPFVICSDNPSIHQHPLTDDHVVALAEGVPFELLLQQYALAKRYSFIKDLV